MAVSFTLPRARLMWTRTRCSASVPLRHWEQGRAVASGLRYYKSSFSVFGEHVSLVFAC